MAFSGLKMSYIIGEHAPDPPKKARNLGPLYTSRILTGLRLHDTLSYPSQANCSLVICTRVLAQFRFDTTVFFGILK